MWYLSNLSGHFSNLLYWLDFVHLLMMNKHALWTTGSSRSTIMHCTVLEFAWRYYGPFKHLADRDHLSTSFKISCFGSINKSRQNYQNGQTPLYSIINASSLSIEQKLKSFNESPAEGSFMKHNLLDWFGQKYSKLRCLLFGDLFLIGLVWQYSTSCISEPI